MKASHCQLLGTEKLFIFFITFFFSTGISMLIIQIMYFLLLYLVLGCQSSQCISCFAFLLQIPSDSDILLSVLWGKLSSAASYSSDWSSREILWAEAWTSREDNPAKWDCRPICHLPLCCISTFYILVTAQKSVVTGLEWKVFIASVKTAKEPNSKILLELIYGYFSVVNYFSWKFKRQTLFWTYL
jgi:hypothetical protein